MRISDWSSDVCSSDLHHGVDEWFPQGDKAFGDRMTGFYRRMRDRRRTDAGLVGKCGTAKADDERTDDTSLHASGTERAVPDFHECCRHMADVAEDDEQIGRAHV